MALEKTLSLSRPLQWAKLFKSLFVCWASWNPHNEFKISLKNLCQNMKVVTKMNGCCRYTTQPFFEGFQLKSCGSWKHSVCLSELGGVRSHPELTSGNFFLCSCLIHTLSLLEKHSCYCWKLHTLWTVFTSSVHASGACLTRIHLHPDSGVWRFLSFIIHTKMTYSYGHFIILVVWVISNFFNFTVWLNCLKF